MVQVLNSRIVGKLNEMGVDHEIHLELQACLRANDCVSYHVVRTCNDENLWVEDFTTLAQALAAFEEGEVA